MFYYNWNGLLGNDRVMDNFVDIGFTFWTGLLKLTFKYMFKRYIMLMFSVRHFYTVSWILILCLFLVVLQTVSSNLPWGNLNKRVTTTMAEKRTLLKLGKRSAGPRTWIRSTRIWSQRLQQSCYIKKWTMTSPAAHSIIVYTARRFNL